MELVRTKNIAGYFVLPMIDKTDPSLFITGETVADTAYYKDSSGAWTALSITDTFAEIGSTGLYIITLTAAEMNHDQIIIKMTSTNAQDQSVVISTIPAPSNIKEVETDGNLSFKFKDLLTSGYAVGIHAINSDVVAVKTNITLGDRLESLLQGLEIGTAQTGAAGSITLAAGASATSDLYDGMRVVITAGTGIGQSRVIQNYDGSTKVAAVNPNWTTTPDNTSVYCLQPSTSDVSSFDQNGQLMDHFNDFYYNGYDAAVTHTVRSNLLMINTNDIPVNNLQDDYDGTGYNKAASTIGTVTALSAAADSAIADAVWDELRSGHIVAGSFGQANQLIRSGTAQAGGASSITLDASASATTNFYNNTVIHILSGTGTNQSRRVTVYNGSTKVATVANAWSTNPDATSVFIIYPRAEVSATVSATNMDLIADKVWDELRSGHTTAGTFGQGSASVQGNVTGSVGSVTGNVGGNVTGSVGSVTGNVGGNVTGSTGSVVGAVGSVTGAVGSVTSGVTVSTNNDKTGYSISGTKQTLDALNDVSAAGVNAEVDTAISANTDINNIDIGVNAIESKLPSKSYIAGTNNSTGNIEFDAATGQIPAGAFSNLPDVTVEDFSANGKSEINNEVVDVLTVDIQPEIAQGAPAATETIAAMLTRLRMALVNKGTQTGGTGGVKAFFNSSGTTITKKTVTDDGTTYTENKMITGA